jgi:hypothetical protein
MSTLTITIGIVAPVITFLIGLFFRMQELYRVMQERDDFKNRLSERINSDYYHASRLETRNRELQTHNETILKELKGCSTLLAEAHTFMNGAPFVQIVPNINPHHAADNDYVGVYPNNGIEPAHLTREEYQKGVDRLKDNLEDNILTKPQ